MIPEVTRADIPNFYDGDLSEFTDGFLNGKLGEVVDKIASRWGSTVRERLASGVLTPRLYTAVVVRVAARVFENTRGFKKENEGQYGYELNPAVASGTLWFTDEDITDLTGVAPKQSNAIGTATIGRHTPRWS